MGCSELATQGVAMLFCVVLECMLRYSSSPLAVSPPFRPCSGDAAARSAAHGLYMQIGLFCDDHCRLEWIIPYLLHYVIPDKPAQQGRAAASPSSIEDTVPRTIVLSQLPLIIAQLSGLPRSERSLFNSYIMPMLAALPDRQASVLRAQSAQSLAVIAEAASALQQRALRAAMLEGTHLSPSLLHHHFPGCHLTCPTHNTVSCMLPHQALERYVTAHSAHW